MANNFRITGDRYYSKDGNDANDGLTEDTPKATPSDARNAVIGTGEYKGAFNLSTASGANQLDIDGFVKMLATDNILYGNQSTGGGSDLNGKPDAGYLSIDLNSFAFYANSVNGINLLNKLILNNGIYTTNSFTGTIQAKLRNSVLVDCTTQNLGGGAANSIRTYDKVIFFNCTAYSATDRDSFNSCFMDSSFLCNMTTYFSNPANQNNNCNFQGKFSIAGTLYELKKDRNGVDIPARIGNGIADLIDIDATVYDRGNFSQDPEFLNIDKRDYFSVASTSPLLFGASDGSNIGRVRAATLIKVGTDTATLTDILTSSGDYIYDTLAVNDFGTATFVAKQVAPVAQQIGRVDLGELLNFNSDEAIGSGENTNVVIADNYVTGTIGANPRRLTYEMRWTDADDVPTVDADWTNQGYTDAAGDFSKFEHFTVPLIDVLGRGNGDQRFITAGAVPIKAKWVQVRITIFEGIG